MPHVQFGKVRLWFETAGDQGPRVLLIMGLATAGDAWAPQVLGLQGTSRVAWFDNRGVGRSESPRRPYRCRVMADDAAALLDHLGWDQAHVVGVSMGGMIAQHLALNHRARVQSLSLIATHAGGGALPPSPLALCLFAGTRFGSPDARWRRLSRALFPVDYLASPESLPLLTAMRSVVGSRDDHTAVALHLPAVFTHRSAHRLHELDGLPTLIIRPGRDIVIHPRESDRLHRLIPGSRLVRFDRAGHGINAQCAEALNANLREHFTTAFPS